MADESKIIKRIKNLLDMAGDSATPNEAMIAAKRARFLMDKHQISKADLLKVTDDTFCESSTERSYKNVPKWVMHLAVSVAELNDCESVICHSNSSIVFEYRGFKSDSVIAKYMHDYLVETCERLLNKTEIRGRSNKNFYRLGFSSEIDNKVDEIVSERKLAMRSSTGTDLVLTKKEMIASHFGELSEHRSSRTREPNAEEMQAYFAGSEDAKNVSLNQQINNDKNLFLSGAA